MLEPVDIEQVWSQMEPEARKLLPDPDTIREECRAGQAMAFRCEDGFLVMSIKIDPSTSQRYIHLRWGNSVTNIAGAFERVLPDIHKVATALNCSGIRFDTRVLGWLRLAPRLGFLLQRMTFELPIPDGRRHA